MKKRKGFTLIELLAVIVILAIIALIAVPIILNMIQNARKSAAIDTAYGYVESVEYAMGLSDIGANGYENIDIKDQEYDISDPDLANIKIKGKKPQSGTIVIEKRKVKSGTFCIDEFTVDYDGKEAKIASVNTCKGEDEEAASTPLAYPENPEETIPDKVPCELEKENGKEIYYIDSEDDMYAFASSVNSGTTYEGKTVVLRNNLDFKNYTSDKKSKVCENNDNENGFTPIGNTNNNFRGTFNGKAKVIKNLTINRPNQDYVGLFGSLKYGTIYGLRLKNIKVTGREYVGSLAGWYGRDGNTGLIPYMYEIELDSVDVSGTGNNVGGLIGFGNGWSRDWPSNLNNILVKSGKSSGKAVIGAASGTIYINNIIVENMESEVYDSYVTAYSSKVTATDEGKTKQFPESDIGDLNYYETVGLDTWIGGDNNSSGYYFDYESATSKNIILKSKERFPMPANLDSAFDKENGYYLIKNELDWRNVAIFATSEENYKITNDINWKNKNFYMLGSANNSFLGTVNGGGNKISNVTINATKADNIGIFGYMRGNVYGLIIDNIKVIGNNNVGSLAGFFGHNGNGGVYPRMYEIEVRNVDVKGTGSNVGGVAGAANGYNGSWPAYMNNILVKSGKSSGKAVAGTYNSVLYNSAIIVEDMNSSVYDPLPTRYSEKVKSDEEKTKQFPNTDIGDINFYEAVGLDTWIAGDNNSSGYYFDYESATSNNIVLKSIAKNPIPTDINDTFETSGNYYLIKNEDDWKNATAFVTASPNYLLSADLNFSQKHFYMMGSGNNQYVGTLNGGGNKISNVTIKATKADNIGIFGYMRGNVYGLIIDNIKVIGNNNVGSLAGFFGHNGNGGVYPRMYEIEVRNVDVKGTESNVGGLAGYTQGYNDSWPAYMNNILVKSGKSSGKAVAGTYNNRLYNSAIIVEDMNSSVYDPLPTRYSEKVKSDEEKTKQFPNTDIGDINFYEAIGLDTWIAGDNNSSGYYFDYESATSNNIVLKSIAKNPIPTNIGDTFETSGNYYLIKNEDDWKKATAFVLASPNYKITNNLNFSNKKFYMMGSSNNQYVGTLNGGGKTISNVTIKATKSDYLGIFGYMRGNVYGLNLNTIKISGNNYIGSLAGYFGHNCYGGVTPHMYEITLKDINTNGTGSNIGGLVGYGYGCNDSWRAYLNNILVKSGSTSGKSIVGSYAGYFDTGSIIVENMNAKESDPIVSYNSEKVKVNGTPVSNGFDESNINSLYYYNGKIETSLGGDSNGSGYFFDYDYEKDGVYVMNTKTNQGWKLVTPKEPKNNQKWFYFQNGTKITNGWGRNLTDLSGNLRDYYFDSDGYVIKGWKQIGSEWYYFSEKDDDNNGYIDFNKVFGGTITINGKSYTFNSDGVCTSNNCGS